MKTLFGIILSWIRPTFSSSFFPIFDQWTVLCPTKWMFHLQCTQGKIRVPRTKVPIGAWPGLEWLSIAFEKIAITSLWMSPHFEKPDFHCKWGAKQPNCNSLSGRASKVSSRPLITTYQQEALLLFCTSLSLCPEKSHKRDARQSWEVGSYFQFLIQPSFLSRWMEKLKTLTDDPFNPFQSPCNTSLFRLDGVRVIGFAISFRKLEGPDCHLGIQCIISIIGSYKPSSCYTQSSSPSVCALSFNVFRDTIIHTLFFTSNASFNEYNMSLVALWNQGTLLEWQTGAAFLHLSTGALYWRLGGSCQQDLFNITNYAIVG